ncbi:MAG: DUF1989 domain-containing protein [Alphaproteobacteria bacterium]
MPSPEQQLIPAREGRALRLSQGRLVRLINTHGGQVVDTWAFRADDLDEFMSMAHSRVALGRINPRQGDTLVSNKRQPILTMTEDTTAGIHDTLVAACDRYRYEQLGVQGPHANCTDNLRGALDALGLKAPTTPPPLNMFMNIPFEADGRFRFEPAPARAGEFVTLRAEQDVVVAFSACPMDILPINGRDAAPREAHFEVLT